MPAFAVPVPAAIAMPIFSAWVALPMSFAVPRRAVLPILVAVLSSTAVLPRAARRRWGWLYRDGFARLWERGGRRA